MASLVISRMSEVNEEVIDEEEDEESIVSLPPLQDQLKAISLVKALMEDKFGAQSSTIRDLVRAQGQLRIDIEGCKTQSKITSFFNKI